MGGRFGWLCRGKTQLVGAGENGPIPLVIDAGERSRRKGDVDVALFLRLQVHALEADQRMQRTVRLRRLEIRLDHLVAGTCAGVGDGDRGGKRLAGGHARARQGDGAVPEAGVAQAVSKAP